MLKRLHLGVMGMACIVATACAPAGNGTGNSAGGSSSGGSSSGGSSSGGSSSGGSSSGALTVEQFALQLVLGGCDEDERCSATHGRSYSTLAACQAAAERDAALTQFFIAVFYEYHAEHAEACVAHLANAACGTQPLDGVCAQALVDIAGHGPGSQCGGSASLTLCNNGLYCAGSTNAACGMCTADKTAGQACVNDYPTGCGAGLFCDAPSGGSGVCTAERLAGETCANGGCTGALDCRTSTGAASTCQPRVGQGAGCEDALCYYDFVCSGTSGRTCKVPLANGVSCTRQSEDPPCAEYCVFSAPDAATGTCGTPPDELSGQPCPYASTYASCGFGQYASRTETNGTVTSCVCMAELLPGAECPDYRTCTTVCEGADPNANPPVMGTCAQPKANGTECLSNSECASGECNYQVSPAICVDALACN